MSNQIKEDQWVWVVIQDPGANESFLGQEDQEKGVSFIPAFLEKEEAQEGMALLKRDKTRKYEVQAIQFHDLKDRAKENGFAVFVLSASGDVLQKVDT